MELSHFYKFLKNDSVYVPSSPYPLLAIHSFINKVKRHSYKKNNLKITRGPISKKIYRRPNSKNYLGTTLKQNDCSFFLPTKKI